MEKTTHTAPPSAACRLIERIASRWALRTLTTLHRAGTLRFAELRRAIPGGISERMLAATLDALEADGLVRRTAYPEVPPRVEYRTTSRAATLLPLVGQLHDWAQAQTAGPAEPARTEEQTPAPTGAAFAETAP